MLNRRANWRYLFLLSTSLFRLHVHADDGWTKIHEEGRCAIRGHCGSESLFGPQLPCPDNGEAEEPTADMRKKLIDICGDKWIDTLVCCKEEQVHAVGMSLRQLQVLTKMIA
jgi:Niemann-Pick C1 protein